MNFLSASNVFSDIFEWFANLSSKLPAIDYKTYFIVVVVLLLGIGLIVALTYFGSYRFKLMVACRKIIRYLSEVDAIDNDNFGDFTAQCFSAKVPSALRDCWVQYLGVRFGYPSDIVSEQNVYDKQVKRVREIRANVYIAIALILIAIFAFLGYGRLEGNDMGVIFLAGLLISGVTYLVLVIINKMLSTKCLDTFSNMQEDLDAKVVFQVEKSFATDSSPLADLSAIIDEIVARNTAKEIGFEFADEQTPIEELIAQTAEEGNVIGNEIPVEDAPAETVEKQEPILEENTENISIDEIIETSEVTPEDSVVQDSASVDEEDKEETAVEEFAETVEEPMTEEAVDGVVEETVETESAELAETSEDQSEETVEEIVVESEQEVEQKVAEPVEEENTKAEEATESCEPANVEEEQDIAETAEEQPEPVEETEVVEPTVDAQEETTADAEELDNDVKKEDEEQKKSSEQSDVTADESVDSTAEPDAESAEDKENEGIEDAEDVQDDPVIRYVVDGPTEDEEIVKPAQLVKMPNLVDYMIAQKVSPKVKMKVTNMLMASYKKFEDSDEDKKIIMDCIKKLMADLQNNK